MATYMRIGAVGASKSDIQIRGDVSDEGHVDWIELASFSFGSAPSQDEGEEEDDDDDESTGSANKKKAQAKKNPPKTLEDERASGSQRFRETGFSLSKWGGADSPKILDWALSGKPYDIQIDCCNENGEPFMRFFMTEAQVQAVATYVHQLGGGETEE